MRRRGLLRTGSRGPCRSATIRAPFGALCTTSCAAARTCASTAHWLDDDGAELRRTASARRSQFSSTWLPRISSAPGLDRRRWRRRSRRAAGSRRASRSRFGLSRPSQFSSTPLSNTSGAPGKMFAAPSLQSTAELKPSRSPSTPRSHSAMMSMKSLCASSVPAPQEIRSGVAVARLDRVVAGLAEVVVDAASCPSSVSLPGPPASTSGPPLVPMSSLPVAAGDADRDRHRDRREAVVAAAEVDRDARAQRALDRRADRACSRCCRWSGRRRAADRCRPRRRARRRCRRRRASSSTIVRTPVVRVTVDGGAERGGRQQREAEHGDGEGASGRAHERDPLRSPWATATAGAADAGGRARRRDRCARRILLHHDPRIVGCPPGKVHSLSLQGGAPSNHRPMVSKRTLVAES